MDTAGDLRTIQASHDTGPRSAGQPAQDYRWPFSDSNLECDHVAKHDAGSSQRADWIAIAVALVLPTLVTLAYFVLAAKSSAGVQQTTYAIAKTCQFLFPAVWVLLIQRRRLQLKPSSTAGLGWGLAFGLLVATAMLLLYHTWLDAEPFFLAAERGIREKIAGMSLASPAAFLAVGVFYSLIHSLLEEYYWRWFVFGQLKERMAAGPAIVISSLGFMAHHVLVIGTYFGFFSPVTWLFSFGVAFGGGVWAWMYHRSGSLLGPWLSHMLVDAAIFLIGYEIAF